MAIERGLHELPLDADPLAVDDADLAEAGRVSGVEIIVQDGFDVARREGMEIERVADRKFMQGARSGPSRRS